MPQPAQGDPAQGCLQHGVGQGLTNNAEHRIMGIEKGVAGKRSAPHQTWFIRTPPRVGDCRRGFLWSQGYDTDRYKKDERQKIVQSHKYRLLS